MCAMSMVGDYYGDKFKDPGYPWNPMIPMPWPQVPSVPTPSLPGPIQPMSPLVFQREVTRDEFEVLVKEVQTMKELLIRAKIYDEETGQKDCEMEEKVKTLRAVAELLGVSLEEVFGK